MCYFAAVGQFKSKRIESDGIDTLYGVIAQGDRSCFASIELCLGNHSQFAVEHTEDGFRPVNTPELSADGSKKELDRLRICEIVCHKAVVVKGHLFALTERLIVDSRRHNVHSFESRTMTCATAKDHIFGSSFHIGSSKIDLDLLTLRHIRAKRHCVLISTLESVVWCAHHLVGQHVHTRDNFDRERRERGLRLCNFHVESDTISAELHIGSQQCCLYLRVARRIDLAEFLLLAADSESGYSQHHQ